MATGAVEMVVFISYENPRSPEATAREMVDALQIERAEFGVDLLTGGCEVRLIYHPDRLAEVRRWLLEHNVIHDISFVS
jgi:hypothetical protein